MSIYKRINCKSGNIEKIAKLSKYIFDEKKTKEQYCHAVGVDKNNVLEDMTLVKQLYRKMNGRQFLHWVLSHDAGVKTDIADCVAMDVMRLLQGKYQVVFATHLNTANRHTHFLINTIDLETGIKFNESIKEMIKFRDGINNILKQYGLSMIGEIEDIDEDSWDEKYEYEEKSSNVYGHVAERVMNDSNDAWVQTWIRPEMFNTFDDGTYEVQTIIEGNIFEGSLWVSNNQIFIPGIVKPAEVQISDDKQKELIRGVTYENTPEDFFEVTQYVNGEKYSGRGKYENEAFLNPGVLYLER